MSSAANARATGRVGGTVQLRYVARAGLLPELSRQTYDSLWKAVREAVLNAVDASATRIDLDLSKVGQGRELTVADDGSGMSIEEFCDQFMALGGSSKFRERDRFGRIGIGSLALLQYGDSAVIETKRSGAATYTRAVVRHSWDLNRSERRESLGDLPAGEAVEEIYDGDSEDHFTRVRILGVNEEVMAVGLDPNAFYALIERLRRALPLPLSDGPLRTALAKDAPELVDVLAEHCQEWSAPVFVHSAWERNVALSRRSFGDEPSGAESWSGPPMPILKTLRVPGDSPRRRVTVAGYLLNQRHAAADWMGITARLQNVAVEEHTFFDVTSDPGFRKYISGEVWILGDVDRERLINIDRASFNRECRDYEAVQRFLARVILEFKSTSVQRPQRAKVAIRRLIENRLSAIDAVGRVVAVASNMYQGKGLPASERGRFRMQNEETLVDLLERHGAVVQVTSKTSSRRSPYDLDMTEDGSAVLVRLHPDANAPYVEARGTRYALKWSRSGSNAAPVVVRDRPRQICVNLDHGSNSEAMSSDKIQTSLALELAYLLSIESDEASLYDVMLSFLEAL